MLAATCFQMSASLTAAWIGWCSPRVMRLYIGLRSATSLTIRYVVSTWRRSKMARAERRAYAVTLSFERGARWSVWPGSTLISNVVVASTRIFRSSRINAMPVAVR